MTSNILKEECDVWIFPAQDVWTYAIPARSIGAIHDLMHHFEARFPEVSAFGRARRRDRHYRRMCQFSSAIMVDSVLGASQVAAVYGAPESILHVLPFVAPPYVLQAKGEEEYEDDRLPRKFLFYPAQFWQHKNHLRLVEAMARVQELLPDLGLVLVGSRKNAYQQVKKRIEKLGLRERVHVLGYVPDERMAILYRRAHALIFPSFFGPTNIPPLEAMACGCPVAIADVYSARDQMGRAALYFDPASIESIATAIVKISVDESLRAELIRESRAQARKWTQESFNRKVEEIIESVLRA